MKTFFGIEIPKRNAKCAHADEELVAGERVYSVINQGEEGFLRDDFCEKCWNEIKDGESVRSALTYWKSVYPEKKVEEKEVFLDRDEKALSFFKTMASSTSLDEQQQAYILGLYLARRRQIYNRKEFINDDEQATILFEVASTQDVIPVRKFEFSDLDVDAIQKVLAKKLKD
ncbi:MAG: hypothetical protein VX777_10220 [Chlamydiota bacterium]|nr:hypothetical protein [Chlamydiota bacterium]